MCYRGFVCHITPCDDGSHIGAKLSIGLIQFALQYGRLNKKKPQVIGKTYFLRLSSNALIVRFLPCSVFHNCIGIFNTIC